MGLSLPFIYFLTMFYFLFFLIFSNTVIGNQDQIYPQNNPVSLLPPTSQNMSLDSNLALTQRIEKLEDEVERLKQIVDVLRITIDENKGSVVTTGPISPPAPSKPEPRKKEEIFQFVPQNDPVADFEKIKKMAISKDANIDEAVNIFKSSYKDTPLVPKVHFFLADYYHSRGDYERSIALVKDGLALYPKSSQEAAGIWTLFLNFKSLGKTTDACITLKKLVSLDTAPMDLKTNAYQYIQRLNCQ
jgi:TolA-binding protein